MSAVPIGLVATATHVPARWAGSAELAGLTGVPEQVLVDKFGLHGKYLAGEDEHVSGLAAAAGRAVLEQSGTNPAAVDAVLYFGSTFKDYPVWQVSPCIAHELGCTSAFALELDYVSCGAPVALRVARDLLAAEDNLRTVLLVAAACESRLVDYTNPRTRFMLPFGDGAVAGLLVRGQQSGQVLGSHMVTDGSLTHQVRVPAGGSRQPSTHATVTAGRHFLDVADPASLGARLDQVSLPNFLTVAEQACKRSGLTLADVDYLCSVHLKPSMHAVLLEALGLMPSQAAYLDRFRHMSGVDSLLAYDQARRSGAITDGDVVLLLAAGTGYTWAATIVQAGAEPT